MTDIKELEPKEVFYWFYELNQIPRCSGDEKEASDFLVNFARERDLEVHQDEMYNVIIKKPGTKGYENSNPVIIQGHIDMVCVKGPGSNHDFTKDPIEMIVDGDFLRANDTTLGGDNGIAIAYGLAVLDSDKLKHPPLELLVTTNEEVGMFGAHALKNDNLSGKILLNIDSEEEGTFLVSCAGGSTRITRFKLEKEERKSQGLEIEISGLQGGHSGLEIVKQRANAIKLMARILDHGRRHSDLTISEISGGTKHNAITNIAKVKIRTDNRDALRKVIDDFSEELKEEYRVEDPGLTVKIKDIEIEETYKEDLSENLIDYLMMIPNGVQYMSKDIEGLVETSLNNAIIKEKDGNVEILTSIRSSSSSSLKEIVNILEITAKRTGGQVENNTNYPAWEYDEDSKVRAIALKVYKELFSKEGKVSAIHAGLECGLLKEILPDTDMISFGPDMYDVHTEKERIDILSAGRIWKFIVALLENLQ